MDEKYAAEAKKESERFANVPAGLISGAMGRSQASEYLKKRAEQLRREAHEMDSLAYQIAGLGQEAENAMWALIHPPKR